MVHLGETICHKRGRRTIAGACTFDALDLSPSSATTRMACGGFPDAQLFFGTGEQIFKRDGESKIFICWLDSKRARRNVGFLCPSCPLVFFVVFVVFLGKRKGWHCRRGKMRKFSLGRKHKITRHSTTQHSPQH